MLDWLFRKRVTEPKPARTPFRMQEPPQPGQRWVLTDTDDDPFGAKGYLPVKILEVRNGWVRYYMGRLFPDERKKVVDFMHLYHRVK